MGSSYIPERDLPALQWMQTFSNGIAANPGMYQLSGADSSAIAGVVSAYDTALQIAAEPTTRTPITVANKDAARNSAKQLCRQYAMMIRPNGGISDAGKQAIGIRPINPDREPIPCPGTSPLLSVVASTQGAQTVKYVDALNPDISAKPFGATEVQLFLHVADTSSSNPNDAKFLGKYTKNPIVVAFDATQNGKQATYFARWASRRGDVGPWSAAATLAIAA